MVSSLIIGSTKTVHRVDAFHQLSTKQWLNAKSSDVVKVGCNLLAVCTTEQQINGEQSDNAAGGWNQPAVNTIDQ
jgi:hypothetical protein